MGVEEFLDLLSYGELKELARILGLDTSGHPREEYIQIILKSLHVRRIIKSKIGRNVKVRFKPTYGNGWRWCSRCRVSFVYFNGRSLKRCPLCGGLLRGNRRRKSAGIPGLGKSN